MNLEFPDPLAGLIAECETECVAGCCGLDAFEIDSEQMIPWASEQPIHVLWEVLDQLTGVVWDLSTHSGSVSSSTFNAIWEPTVEALAFFRTFQTHVIRAVEIVAEKSLMVEPLWLTSTVVALARGIYDDRAFDRLPILADALQDAGCDNAEVLNHCRDTGPHARGCWVVDLLLGKA